jgi:uncharacterized protein YdeI (YjbR/CyaY-like superfamily)
VTALPGSKDTFFATDRRTWRAWLRKNGRRTSEIWLVFYKKHTGERCVSYDAAVEEALCWGWIDGKLRRIDDRKHMVRFTPRRPGSIWSEANKARVRRMIRQGKMTRAGLALVEDAKKSGQWQRASARETADEPPPDLKRALARNRKARENFEAFAPSYRKMYVAWVLDAKREETRKRRIAKVVERSAQNKKPGIDL